MRKPKNLGWSLAAWLCGLLLVVPIAAIFFEASSPSGELFGHLWDSVLSSYLTNSLLLVAGTVGLSLLLGLPAAWLMAMYRFPGQKVLQWALCLPLALPGYLVAYLYTDLLDFSGPVQGSLRALFGWRTLQDYWFPPIRTLGGACLILALVLYPYIYLLTRTALMEQSSTLLQSARLLRASPWQVLWRVCLPLARPAIAVGASLVAMETLGDFGTVAYFAVPTLTTAVYDTWLGYGDLSAASKIAALMLLAVFVLVSLERYSRRRQRVYQKHMGREAHELMPLHGWRSAGAQLYCWTLVLLAFGLPVGKLLYWVMLYFEQSWTAQFLTYSWHSLSVSLLASGLTLLVALLLNFYHRLQPRNYSSVPMRLASLGYAVPGTVLAIGLLIPLTGADHGLNALAKSLGLPLPGLVFSGSLLALVFAYSVRFSAMAVGGVESTLAKVSPSLDMVSRTLGSRPLSMLRRVHLPLLRRGLLTAAMMVFIESMKELNASLLLRPFNFDTLATHVFTFTSDEQLELAALPALVLVLVGLLPVIWLNLSLQRKS
ncbi:ABC transporter permease [Plesiomonas shigelloides]|uniref:ABC transporter permease n=1 Tax=Plesiomonas shigelloides TaxID=703 RepID=UPI001261E28F|nr:iron ABC transporter permease [Plesiomonas shigelloides]KAB7664008.1 ABC transporter permease subunit [Plesiomonas shigelloides]